MAAVLSSVAVRGSDHREHKERDVGEVLMHEMKDGGPRSISIVLDPEGYCSLELGGKGKCCSSE